MKTIDLAAAIETALQISKATEKDKEIARICEAMKRASKPASNLSKDEQKAIESLRGNDNMKV